MRNKIKILVIIIASIIVLFAIGAIGYNELYVNKPIAPKKTISLTEEGIKNPHDYMLTAHRGFSGIAPENTLPAFEQACKNGFYGVEFDIQLTKDFNWIVMHDSSIKHMTAAEGTVSKMTLEEIKSPNITNGANIADYENVKIPTLEETFELISKYDIVPVIEIKTSDEKGIEEFYAMLQKYGYTEKAWVISFNEKPLAALRKLSDKVQIAYLVKEVKSADIDLALENGFNGISFNHKKNDEKNVKMVLDAGLVPQTWTVDTIEAFNKFASYGVKMFTGNCICY